MDTLGIFVLMGSLALMLVVMSVMVTVYAVRLNRYRDTVCRALQQLRDVKGVTHQQDYSLICARNVLLSVLD